MGVIFDPSTDFEHVIAANLYGKEIEMLWFLKQLVPLTYRSHYADQAGQRYFVVWRMWLGHCFDVELHAVR